MTSPPLLTPRVCSRSHGPQPLLGSLKLVDDVLLDVERVGVLAPLVGGERADRDQDLSIVREEDRRVSARARWKAEQKQKGRKED